MSVGFSNSLRRAVTVVFLLLVATSGTLRAADESRPRGRPIEFSDLDGGAASTNTITLGSPTLRRLDPLDRITRPGSIDFRTSRPPQMPPPSSGIIISNKRNNQSDAWASPDDAVNNYVMGQILGIPNYLSDDSSSAPFSSRGNFGFLSRNRGQTNSPARKNFSFADPEGSGDDRQDAESERGSRRAISSDGAASSTKILFSTGSGGFGSPTRGSEAFADHLGYNRRVDTAADELRERKTREEQLDAFKRNLTFQPPAPAASFNPLSVTPAPAMRAGSPGSLAPQTSFNPLPGAVNSTFIPGAPTAPTAPGVPSVPGLSGYLPPDPPPPSKLSRPEPVVVSPRRPF